MNNVKEKTYSLRINITLKKTSPSEALRQIEMFINELPRMEGFYNQGYSVYDVKDKKVIKEIINENS